MAALLLFAALLATPQELGRKPDSPLDAWRFAHEAHQRGNLKEAEAAYRTALIEWPDSDMADSCREGLGDVLVGLKRYPEARAIFTQMTAEDARRQDAKNRPIRPELFMKIGKSHESEGNWEKALEAYQVGAQRGAFDFGGCGTCEDQKQLASQTRLIRCLHRLGRDETTLQMCRDVIFGTVGRTGGRSTEIAIIAVDTAIRMGRLEEFERDLIGQAPRRFGGNHAQEALEYLRLLRLRSAGKLERLFHDYVRAPDSSVSLINDHFRWNRRSGASLLVEAVECLAELGEPAWTWLEHEVRSGGDTSAMWAVTVMAHYRDARAHRLAADPPWKPRDPRDAEQFTHMLQGIANESPRLRRYPPQPAAVSSFILIGVVLIIGVGVSTVWMRSSRSRTIP